MESWWNALSRAEQVLFAVGLPAVAGVALYTTTRRPAQTEEADPEPPLVYGPVASAPSDLGLTSQLSAFEDAVTEAILSLGNVSEPEVPAPTDDTSGPPPAPPAPSVIVQPVLIIGADGMPQPVTGGTDLTESPVIPDPGSIYRPPTGITSEKPPIPSVTSREVVTTLAGTNVPGTSTDEPTPQAVMDLLAGTPSTPAGAINRRPRRTTVRTVRRSAPSSPSSRSRTSAADRALM